VLITDVPEVDETMLTDVEAGIGLWPHNVRTSHQYRANQQAQLACTDTAWQVNVKYRTKLLQELGSRIGRQSG